MTATAQRTYGCTTCGRTSTATEKWVIRGPEVIAQGVHLATCGSCFGRDSASADVCDGNCDGQYKSSAGTYYMAEIRDAGFGGWLPGWSCWDHACVEGYDPDDDGGECECPHCTGDHYDIRYITVTDGKRMETTR